MKPHELQDANRKGHIAIQTLTQTAFALVDQVGADAVASGLMFTLGVSMAGTVQQAKPGTFTTEEQIDEFARQVSIAVVGACNSILKQHGCELPIVDLRNGKPGNN